ncbi:MAG: extracellular solute-binding protein [Candidatus Omnitrophica bacterium]|nr:extracellular solute-binding protein [Candidatus Omnitrophota bacterium]
MNNPVLVKFWIIVGGINTGQIIGKEIEEFEKTHPGIRIDLSTIPWTQAWKRIITAAKTKQLPDIFQIGNTWTKTLSSIGSLADLTEEAGEDRMKNKFHPASWVTCEAEETRRVYALPWGAETRMLFYRKDIFSRLNLSAKDISTWELFEKTCAILKGHEHGSEQVAALGVSDIKDQGLVHDVVPWIWSSGGDYLSKDGLTAAFGKDEALNGIRFYFDLMNRDYAPIRDRKVPSFGGHGFFVTGKYAMCIAGASVVAGYLPDFFGTSSDSASPEIREKFGVTYVPAGPAGRFSFLGGNNLAISSRSTHKDEAWQFMRFLTSNESQINLYKAMGTMPAGIEPFTILFCENAEREEVLKNTYSEYGRSYRQIDFWGGVEFIMTEFFGNLIDAVKTRKYNEKYLATEAKRYAAQVDYILSL